MLAELSPLEVTGLVVSLVGLIPVVTQYRDETKLFTAGYVLLVAGMVATNVEVFLLEPLFNFVEHGLGIGMAGITFLAAAYVRRQQVINTE
ncbi:hypothetical protein E6P09_01210 [Haloferax mediterranei ATCC 33500]|uniref:Uncharacterized protein n=1 Tax=Haloferax mediterranei (strain ATCC 33500 / DSM 1411 / JCM 8866 / NBRC 14739 / NCIMB 2177 / R-4) TaxID=523841 RepID=I3R6C7_HALMT|nr:hypothetical protein [Haloferax mediterranei]AFK19787.1 hypothetical protein HFX_2096 [Haloferax mediterranei ATCC 33500]AHZ23174.1 hypothetical protein BM92_11235 [Haloferax mediterranei ATCC 33500]MDX5987466.1 hypothetical protein [Haloferax mediterranei ATCC 33500]QCQ73966.1 hypothetical protein E6P09_01210 [Haloferax mediterranei ATCC 33500]